MIQVEQDPVEHLRVIQCGRVKVSRFLRDGREIIYGFREDGGVFGEIEVLERAKAGCSVTAVRPTVTCSLRRSVVVELLKEPGFAAAFRRLLCRRCRDAYAQAEVLAVNNAGARVRVALHRLSKASAAPGLTHEDLGGLTGVSRETVSRIVGALQQQYLLEAGRGRVSVKEPDRLLDELLND